MVSIEVQVGKNKGKKVDLDDMDKKREKPNPMFRRVVTTGNPKQIVTQPQPATPPAVGAPINDGFGNAEKDILSITAQIRTAALVSTDKEGTLKLLREVLREVLEKT